MGSEPSWASRAHQNQSGLEFPLFAHLLFGFSQAQVQQCRGHGSNPWSGNEDPVGEWGAGAQGGRQGCRLPWRFNCN